MPLLAEDVLLLLLDDESGKFSLGDNHQLALAGAVMAELAMAGAVDFDKGSGMFERRRVSVDDSITVSDPVLVDAVAVIAEKERLAGNLLNRLSRGLDEQLCARLVDRGVLRREEAKILGLFPRTVWPEADSAREDALRASLRRVLLEGREPDEHSAVLIAVLLSVDRLKAVMGKDSERAGARNRDVKARAELVASGGWATDEVRRALDAARAAAVSAAIGGGEVAGS